MLLNWFFPRLLARLLPVVIFIWFTIVYGALFGFGRRARDRIALLRQCLFHRYRQFGYAVFELFLDTFAAPLVTVERVFIFSGISDGMFARLYSACWYICFRFWANLAVDFFIRFSFAVFMLARKFEIVSLNLLLLILRSFKVALLNAWQDLFSVTRTVF